MDQLEFFRYVIHILHGSGLRYMVVGSFGKTFHATGWKVGYVLAPPEISAEIRRVHQFTVFTVNSAVQNGLAEFLRSERKRVPGRVLSEADRLECLFFGGFDPHFEGDEPPGL